MDSSGYLKQAERDAKIIEALNVALHTLVVKDGMRVRWEGEERTLDFRPQIARCATPCKCSAWIHPSR